jgi:ketosteroid isomerase-like protein
MALVVLTVVVIVGLKAIIETDEEAIEQVTNACRMAFLTEDVDGVLAALTGDAVFHSRTGRRRSKTKCEDGWSRSRDESGRSP